MQQKDGSCYLCVLMEENYRQQTNLEEHHVINGNPGRRMSEKYGLKVYLCIRHHRTGKEAVHRNAENMRLLKAKGQQAFNKAYPELDWMSIFGKNYLE